MVAMAAHPFQGSLSFTHDRKNGEQLELKKTNIFATFSSYISTLSYDFILIWEYSQQLAVEDPDDTKTLQAVGGCATFTFLEGIW